MDEGADVLDVGGESTRPGAEPVPAAEEIARVAPVIEGLAARIPGVPSSVDTRKPQVAGAALDAGASIVNDIGAGAEPGMFEVVVAREAGMVLMHMQGEPRTMQVEPTYVDVVGRSRTSCATGAGRRSLPGSSATDSASTRGSGSGRT